MKYKLTGLSESAKLLDVFEYRALKDMVGSEIFLDEKETENRSGKMFIMLDGEQCHGRFLIVEITK
jgi:hypothetical protein